MNRAHWRQADLPLYTQWSNELFKIHSRVSILKPAPIIFSISAVPASNKNLGEDFCSIHLFGTNWTQKEKERKKLFFKFRYLEIPVAACARKKENPASTKDKSQRGIAGIKDVL